MSKATKLKVGYAIANLNTKQFEFMLGFCSALLGIWLLVVDGQRYSVLYKAFNEPVRHEFWAAFGLFNGLFGFMALTVQYPRFRVWALRLNVAFWCIVATALHIVDPQLYLSWLSYTFAGICFLSLVHATAVQE